VKPWICVSVQSRTTSQTLEDIKRIEDADLIEIRLDYREEPLDLAKIVEASKIPLIGTNRRPDQGGKAQEEESNRVQLLREAVEAGFMYIDLASTTENLSTVVKELHGMGAKVIASYHDFENPLSYMQLEEKYWELIKTESDIIKIIGWANGVVDNIPYLAFNKKHPRNLFFGMGEAGVTSRIMAPLSGALYTYASLEDGKELAPGQVPLSRLREIYRSIDR
jgi:3-dehydroquinate dehydratase type I